ncbi:NAD(P)H-dependent oxidoreductase [Lactobacillus sp. AN1001]
MKTIILVFHPDLAHSRVNKTLVNALGQEFEVRDMYQLYPDFKIDVATEKHHLESADRIVLQFPMYWYSSPALLKQWLDDVLEFGWAYGIGGDALKQKELLIAVSPGADNYGHEGVVKYTVTELLRPFQATSRLIQMKYLRPFITLGASNISDRELLAQAQKYKDYLATVELPLLEDFE